MADSGETNGTGAAATETTGEDQQVRSSVTQKLTYYKTVILPTHLKPTISNLISCCELPILNILVQRHCLYFLIFVLFFFIQNVVSRVSNLALVSSACEVVSRSYTSTKESMPLLKGVMDAAESGVRTLGAAATTGSKPLLDIIEPQREFIYTNKEYHKC